MNTILVPTDFSTHALKASIYAMELAQRSNATVHFLHGYNVFQSGFQSQQDNDRDEIRAFEEAEASMDAFRIQAVTDFPYVIVKTDCLKGSIITLIHELTNTHPIDLIVMGTSGATGFKYQFFGTNTYDVAESLNIPLLVVPVNTAQFHIDNIALFTDYQEDDRQTIASLYSLFGTESINYILVHIHELKKAPTDTDIKKLAAYAMQLQANTPITAMDWEMIHGEESIASVNHIVNEFRIDLLAITMAERNLLDRLLDKSLSKEIVMQAKTPVFIGR